MNPLWVVAHHGVEALLPAAVGASAIAVHYVRALLRLRSGRRAGRPAAPAGGDSALGASTAGTSTPRE